MEKILANCVDVYKLPYYWTSFKLSDYVIGCYYNYFCEIGVYFYNLNSKFERENTRIFTKVHMQYHIDFRRYWRLASVWYIDEDNNEIPFMVIQNAGREGDDYTTRIISNKNTFLEATNYLRNLLLDSSNIEDFIKKDIPKMPIKEIIMTNEEPNKDIDTYIDNKNDMICTRYTWGYIDGETKYRIQKGLGDFCGRDYFDIFNGNLVLEFEEDCYIVTDKREVDY